MTTPVQNEESKYRFVAFEGGKTVQGAVNKRDMRSHVRRSILRNYKTRDIQENLRFYLPPTSPLDTSISPRQKRTHAKKDTGNQFPNEGFLAPASSHYPAPTSGDYLPSHPFTAYICKHVPLSAARIDGLLKSVAFRIAAEPLFDARHVDSDRGLTQVFPGCLSRPAFLNALMYSVMQAENNDHAPADGLPLKAKSIRDINQMITSGAGSTHTDLIGTIMILKATAYRASDVLAHEAHSGGLAEFLKQCDSQKKVLPAFTARAAYWLDLNGAVLMKSPRQLLHLNSPDYSQNREHLPRQATKAPPGISAHWDVIPDNLLACYEDVVGLDAAMADKLHPCHSVDDIQASVESRLANLADFCRDFNVAAECSRLAAYICCYTSYVEVWKNFLIPCRCSSQLLDALASSFDDSVWKGRRDLQLWLILVGSCTARLDQGHLGELKSGYNLLVMKLAATISTWPQARTSLQTALSDYIYTDAWFQHQQANRGWSRLVTCIEAYTAVNRESE